MSYMKLMILAPVYLEISKELVETGKHHDHPQQQEFFELKLLRPELDQLALVEAEDCLNSVSTCEFQIKMPFSNERQQPVTSSSRTSKFDLLTSLPPHIDRNYLNFPFLTDKKTFMFLNHSDTKVMFIMRGLSGSGKSSIVSIIRSSFQHVVVCSADDYFYQKDGSYKYDQNLLSSAHETCQQKCEAAIRDRVSVVVIDNTNVRRWEFKFYTDLAKFNGYIVVLVQPKTPWRWNARELAARSKHGVSVEILQQKIAKFDNAMPGYYGWFLNEKRSKCLIRLCSDIFLECLLKFPKLKQDFLRDLELNFENANEDSDKGIISIYYSSESTKSLLLHCTSHFCAWGKAPDARKYYERSDVQQACGQMFILTITGIVITKRTLGARVSLDSAASILFARPEENEWNSQNFKSLQRRKTLGTNVIVNTDEDDQVGKRFNKKNKRNRGMNKNQKKQKNAHAVNNRASKNSATLENEEILDGQFENSVCWQNLDGASSSPLLSTEKKEEAIVSLSDMFPSLNFSNQTRSAHFTIKTARGVESREVNFDLLRACDLEACSVYTMSNFISVSRGHACYYGDGLCCVYFDKPLCVRTLFSGYY